MVILLYTCLQHFGGYDSTRPTALCIISIMAYIRNDLESKGDIYEDAYQLYIQNGMLMITAVCFLVSFKMYTGKRMDATYIT